MLESLRINLFFPSINIYLLIVLLIQERFKKLEHYHPFLPLGKRSFPSGICSLLELESVPYLFPPGYRALMNRQVITFHTSCTCGSHPSALHLLVVLALPQYLDKHRKCQLSLSSSQRCCGSCDHCGWDVLNTVTLSWVLRCSWASRARSQLSGSTA